MSENDIKIRFEFTDGFGNFFTQESKFEVFPDMGETIIDRIVGYLVPSRSYSRERLAEFNTRQWYSYAEAMTE